MFEADSCTFWLRTFPHNLFDCFSHISSSSHIKVLRGIIKVAKLFWKVNLIYNTYAVYDRHLDKNSEGTVDRK